MRNRISSDGKVMPPSISGKNKQGITIKNNPINTIYNFMAGLTLMIGSLTANAQSNEDQIKEVMAAYQSGIEALNTDGKWKILKTHTSARAKK